MYRAVTIPHAMKLNAMLAKKQNCDGMRLSFNQDSDDAGTH
jgi:hypothetical protein